MSPKSHLIKLLSVPSDELIGACAIVRRQAESGRMRFANNQTSQSSSLRVVAFAMISAFLITIAISDAPRLHDQIHHAQGANHDCAVTILSAGNVELCGSAVIVGAPDQPAEYYSFRISTSLRFPAGLGFLLLEHAPPRLS